MLFLYGKTSVNSRWNVQETQATLFSRIYYVLDGEALYKDTSGQKILKKGYLYCLPTNRVYELKRNNNKCFEVLFLHVDIAPCVLSDCIEMFVETDSLLKNILKTCEKYCEVSERNPTSLLSQSVFMPVVEYLKSLNFFLLQSVEIERSIAYIIQNIDSDLPLHKLSAITGYHPQYYIRLFKKSVGTTPHQFILQYRMKKAFYYLTSGKNVEETALLVGFSQAKNFGRAFKSYFGVLPSKITKTIIDNGYL